MSGDAIRRYARWLLLFVLASGALAMFFAVSDRMRPPYAGPLVELGAGAAFVATFWLAFTWGRVDSLRLRLKYAVLSVMFFVGIVLLVGTMFAGILGVWNRYLGATFQPSYGYVLAAIAAVIAMWKSRERLYPEVFANGA